MKKIGILLTNTGTPDAPTVKALRRYLREFLSDKRIVQLPRILWLPILYGLVLTLRPKRSAKLYQKIWTHEGSPMRISMQKIKEKLQAYLNNHASAQFYVEVGMNYGQPSIQSALEKLSKNNIEELTVLPLFPQYSHTTTGSTWDRVNKVLKDWTIENRLVHHYADHKAYIHALAENVRHQWKQHGASEHLLISFHGIPEQFTKAGDPYPLQCEQTARLLATEIQLPQHKWTLCYQSQFGYAKWLKPYTFDVCTQLANKGIKNIDVVCPGFAVDCLETLEEIALRAKHLFQRAGGKSLRYISALNNSEAHINLLGHLINKS